MGSFVGHYLSQGISFKQLSSWGKCDQSWTPPDGVSCDSLFQGTGRELPQTLSLTVLVCMELFKALSAVSVDSSLFVVGPFKNPWLVIGVTVPFLLHLAMVYSPKLGLPGLGKSFGLVRIITYHSTRLFRSQPIFNTPSSCPPQTSASKVPLSLRDWKTALKWSAPILIVEEVMKAIGRYRCQHEGKTQASLSFTKSY